MRRNIYLTVLIVFLLQTVTSASEYRIKRFLSSEGFTRNSVSSIAQDQRGFIWVGTPDGLFKYDGYQFEIFKHEPRNENSLLSSEVNGIHTTRDGKIWFITKRGLSIYNPETKKFVNQEKLPYTDINTFLALENNHMVFGTNDGLYGAVWVEETEKLELSEISLGNLNLSGKLSISSLFQAQDGSIYMGVGRNIVRWENEDALLRKEGTIQAITIDEDLDHRITCIEEIPGMGLLLGSVNGIYLLKKGEKAKEFLCDQTGELHDAKIEKLLLDRRGDLWIATSNKGLFQYHLKQKTCRQYKNDPNNSSSIGSNRVTQLCEDHSGGLWIGTARGGLNRLNIEKKLFHHLCHNPFDSKSLASNVIDGIYEDNKGNVWIGTFNKGLSVVELKEDQFQIHNLETKLDIKRSYSIAQDDEGTMYCGTDGKGLLSFRWDGGVTHLEKIPVKDKSGNLYGDFSKIFIDSKGFFWLGMGKSIPGLIRFDPKNKEKDVLIFTGETDQNTSKIRNVVDICEDQYGDLWVATYNDGVFRVRINKRTRIPYRFRAYTYNPGKNNTLTSNKVFSVLEGSDGNIWIGLFGGGVNRIVPPRKNQKLRIDHFTRKEGLPDDAVYGIIEDDQGNLWISTNNGISKLNIESLELTNYHKDDGLQDNNFRKYAYHKGKSGMVYFGGINGVNYFIPSEIKDNATQPKVLITGMDIFNKPLEYNSNEKGVSIIDKDISFLKDLTLEYSSNTFTFNFVALHFDSPEKNSYKYKLEGFDSDWIYCDSDRQFASYANMKAGHYTFKVMASNSDGIWNPEPATFELTILPPWWLAWWAYLLYSAIILVGLFIFRRLIVMKQEYISRLNLEKVEKEKIQEINKAKLQFFTNISHEFKTPLTLILGPVGDIIRSEDEFSPRIKTDLKLIQSNADRMLRLINQLIDFRKIESGHLSIYKEEGDYIEFVSEIVKSFRAIANKENITLLFSSDLGALPAVFDKDKLEKILYNLLSNAIKFTAAHGMVNLSLRVKQQDSEEDFQDQNTYWAVHNKLQSYIEFRVTDSGEGIQKEDFPKVFERFQGENKCNKEHESFSNSGIGLALTKGLVQLNGGSLGLRSQAGQTCFIVRLPLENEISQESKQKKISLSIDPHKQETQMSIVKCKEEELDDTRPLILVVDDHREIRDFIRQVLHEDYRIIEADNGKEAHESVIKNIPDLIISDVMMPEMDGLEFCKLIKTNEITDHIPVILLTAKTAIEHRIDGLEVGADSYIPKPFNTKHLMVRVKQLLALRSSLRDKFRNNFQLLDRNPSGMKESELKFIKHAESVIDSNIMEEDFTVETLGQEMAYSRMQLYRKLKNITGLSPNEFIRNYRLKRAASILQEGELSVTEVLYQVGFSNKSYFTKCFKEIYGQTPKEYSKKFA